MNADLLSLMAFLLIFEFDLFINQYKKQGDYHFFMVIILGIYNL